MARYLLELSLLEGQCVVFLPVQLAGAALCLARQVLQDCSTPEGEAAWCLASSIHVGRWVIAPSFFQPWISDLNFLQRIFSLTCALFSSEPTLLRIMHILAGAAAKASTQETCATFIKFSSAETLQVSRHPGLINAAGLLGACSWHVWVASLLSSH